MINKSRDRLNSNGSFINLRDLGLSVLSAGLILLSMPPFDYWPLAFMALVPLYLVIREASLLRAALIGWSCGFAVNLGGFFWGIELMEQFSHLSKEMSILNILGVCAYQGTVWLVWAFVCNFFCRYLHLSWLIVAPLFLALLEAAIPMIFPWHLGFTVWRVWPVLQLAELGGPPAVSALLVLINIIFAEGVGALLGQHSFFRSVKLAVWVVVIILCLGLARSIHVAKMRSDMPTMKIGIIQPNFGIMSMEDQKRYGERYVEVLRLGTRELNKLGADLILWQESAFPVLYGDGPKHEHTPSHLYELKGGRNVRFVADTFAHPFSKSLIYHSTTLEGDPGHVGGDLRLAPFVYNEDIFQGSVTQVALKKPNLLITLANHAFFADRTAPHQALALATLREYRGQFNW
jgi:apolipoprotein N-acyltransferase